MALTKAEASRQNGAKSKGPKTPEGKARSSQNALKHGLYASVQALPGEPQQDFKALLASLIATYRPATALECELVRTLALARWRMRRVPALETSILTNELALAEDQIDQQFSEIDDAGRLGFVFRSLAGQSSALPLLIRYEGSLNRVYDRTVRHLAALQKSRNEPNPGPQHRTPPVPQHRTPTVPQHRTPTVPQHRTPTVMEGIS